MLILYGLFQDEKPPCALASLASSYFAVVIFSLIVALGADNWRWKKSSTAYPISIGSHSELHKHENYWVRLCFIGSFCAWQYRSEKKIPLLFVSLGNTALVPCRLRPFRWKSQVNEGILDLAQVAISLFHCKKVKMNVSSALSSWNQWKRLKWQILLWISVKCFSAKVLDKSHLFICTIYSADQAWFEMNWIISDVVNWKEVLYIGPKGSFYLS